MKEKFMRAALKQAKKAEKRDEVPVGCVIVKDGEIIAYIVKCHRFVKHYQQILGNMDRHNVITNAMTKKFRCQEKVYEGE